MAIVQKKKTPTLNQSVLEQLRDVGSNVKQNVQEESQPSQEVFQPQPKPEISKPDVVLFNAAEAQLTREVEAARVELSREFAKATHELHELNNEIVEAQKAVALAPEKAGRYHLIFYTTLKRIVDLLKSITRGASESKLWLQACASKKQKRGWKGNHKKSSFTQNSERAIAAQAG